MKGRSDGSQRTTNAPAPRKPTHDSNPRQITNPFTRPYLQWRVQAGHVVARITRVAQQDAGGVITAAASRAKRVVVALILVLIFICTVITSLSCRSRLRGLGTVVFVCAFAFRLLLRMHRTPVVDMALTNYTRRPPHRLAS